MQTITTYYIGPSNFRGSRYKAITSGKTSVTIECNSALSSEENHVLAFKALIKKMHWDNIKTWAIGHLHDGSTIFVNANDTITID